MGGARAIVLADLDDTLFQSRRKCPPHLDDAALVSMAFGKDGRANGFATDAQASFLNWIRGGACLVPVTARCREGLSRVRISARFAICAHGGVVLENGIPCPVWQRHIGAAAAPHAEALLALETRLRGLGGEALRVRTVEDRHPLFVLAKRRDRDEAALALAMSSIASEIPSGWTVHINGNNAALLPPFLAKAAAVAFLLPKLRAAHPDAPVIGIGDSDSDAGFLRLCDFAMFPTGSQLARSTFGKSA